MLLLSSGAAVAQTRIDRDAGGRIPRPLRRRRRARARHRQQGGQPHRGAGLGDAVRRGRQRSGSFAKIWGWTQAKSERRDNALFSWRWNPDDRKTPVADRNDASDGDILIAWALLRADRRWHDPGIRPCARRVIAEIGRRLLVNASGRLVLLPGAAGFQGQGRRLSSTRPITSIRRWRFRAARCRRRNGGA